MKALILVSGYLEGRQMPRPDVDHEDCFVERCFPRWRRKQSPLLFGGMDGKPMFVHQIYALKSIGVSTIFLAVDFLPEEMKRDLDQLRDELQMTIRVFFRIAPYGTGGWLNLINNRGLVDDEPFFLMRSDVIYDYVLGDMLELHNARGVKATMAITEVSDPENHDVLFKVAADGSVQSVAVNSRTSDSRLISAQTYILNPSVFNLAKTVGRRCMSLEKDILPFLKHRGELTALRIQPPYIDLGQRGFEAGLKGCLSSIVANQDAVPVTNPGPPDEPMYKLEGDVFIDPSAHVDGSNTIGPNVVIGPRCVVAKNVTLRNCILLHGAHLRESSTVVGSIVGKYATVMENGKVINASVLGKGVKIKENVSVSGAVILRGAVQDNVKNGIVKEETDYVPDEVEIPGQRTISQCWKRG